MSETITIKKSTYKTLLVVLVIALMGVSFVSGYIIGGSGTGNVVAQQPSAQQPSQPSQPSAPTQPSAPSPTVAVSADDDPVKGDANAPVEIIEFSDFQCPFCSRFFSDTLPQLEREYIDTGKVKFVYRDFPLDSIHPQATPAAEAANCAKEQDKFWEYHDKIFQNQAIMSPASYKQWAQELGLNTQQFNSCLDSRKYQEEVRKDFQDGASAGVGGTPTFYVNGVELVGAQPFSAFKSIIDQQLA
jgi:protein-disulfide isomerase